MNKARANKSKTFEVTVTSIGVQGDGIANASGERYYVPYSAPGDRLIVSPDKSRKGGRFAKIAHVVTRGPGRVEPVCPHFGACGGCNLQHIAPSAIADIKRGLVETALRRRGLDTDAVRPTVAVPAGERRRVRFALHAGTRAVLGFFAPRSRRVVPIAQCPAARPAVAGLIEPIRSLASTMDTAIASILVTETETGLDLVMDPARDAPLELNDRERLAQFANDHDLARIAWRGCVGPEPVAQRRQPQVRFGRAAVSLPIGAFLQPSVAGQAAILAETEAALNGAGRIADLYAGCGALTFPLSSLAPTHAVEADSGMVAAMRRAASALPVTADARDLARNPLTAAELARFDAVVFDPPRAGAKAQAAALATSDVSRVVAVSCNPGTLARDLRTLVDGGYRLRSVQPIDQFPWSAHVEAVAVLQRTGV